MKYVNACIVSSESLNNDQTCLLNNLISFTVAE